MKTKTWQWWEILLWAYSCIYMILLLLILWLAASNPGIGTSGPSAEYATSSSPMVIWVVLTLPVLVFLVLEGVTHLKHQG
jgi:hypothetical protein